MTSSYRFASRFLTFFPLVAWSLLGAREAEAQGEFTSWTQSPVRCDYPVVDLPFNSREAAFPSMQQSLGITSCFYEWSHRGVLRLFDGEPASAWDAFGRRLAVAAFDILTITLPPGTSWLHEEWHRAVMSSRGISSFNEVYLLDLGAEVIQVSHVDDAELTRLKRDHNPDLVRLAAAGVESSLALNDRVQRHAFFDDVDVFNGPLYALNYINVINYISSGTSSTPTKIKDEREDQEDESERDFVGHDFTSWVYDLHRPDEPYSARGDHPSGNGVDRYRGRDDLTDAEIDFLRLQGQLSYINLLDPFLLRQNAFSAGADADPLLWNATGRHFLTSFGYAIDAKVYLRSESLKQLWTVHAYRNAFRWYPGLEWELIDYELTSIHTLGTKLAVWQQPAGQRFHTTDASTGGLLGLTLGQRLTPTWDLQYQVAGKTQGWVSGTPYLDRVLELRAGLTVRL